ncbi:MAG: elongation factor Ts [Proteobacteria bacterium]|nr:MAG: elongation factor Ts [Pseudomonadota bacterium]QKK12530.1 MAG: elongation factor Ts [Pseudomonadota bacterium]
MQITAALVKELRERTGAGMMECKKALVECQGDIEAAVELMRKSGAAKADKKAGRVAADGAIVVAADTGVAAIVEVNSETDFVAKDSGFKSFADAVAAIILASRPADVEALKDATLADGSTVEAARQALVAKIGENINVRRFVVVEAAGATVAHYLHGGRIGVVVTMKGGSEDLARDVAMHIAASRPVCIAEEQVPADLLAKEREIFAAQAEQSGKPAEIIDKMVDGRIKKYLKEVTLLGQPFVKNPDETVAQLLQKAGAEVLQFVRLEVGEGIEKKQDNFAEEVMAQVKGSN